MKNSALEPLFTRKELAEYLDIHINMVDKLVKNGKLSPTRVGKNVRFRLSEVNSYLERNTNKGGGHNGKLSTHKQG